MKLKNPIPRSVIIIIIIAFVGIGIRFIKPGLKYLIAEATEIRPSESKNSDNKLSQYSANNPADGTDQLIKDALLKVKDTVESAGVPRHSTRFATDSFSDYQIVIKDNLFRNLGSGEPIITEQPVRERPVRQEPEIRREPLGELTLTGIVNLGDNLTALFEDNSMNKAYFLMTGDKLKDYVVEKVSDQSVALVKDESRIVSNLGKKVYYDKNSGSLISNPSNERITQVATASADKSPTPSDTGSSNLSLVEQMRARRKKELEQQ